MNKKEKAQLEFVKKYREERQKERIGNDLQLISNAQEIIINLAKWWIAFMIFAFSTLGFVLGLVCFTIIVGEKGFAIVELLLMFYKYSFGIIIGFMCGYFLLALAKKILRGKQ